MASTRLHISTCVHTQRTGTLTRSVSCSCAPAWTPNSAGIGLAKPVVAAVSWRSAERTGSATRLYVRGGGGCGLHCQWRSRGAGRHLTHTAVANLSQVVLTRAASTRAQRDTALAYAQERYISATKAPVTSPELGGAGPYLVDPGAPTALHFGHLQSFLRGDTGRGC